MGSHCHSCQNIFWLWPPWYWFLLILCKWCFRPSRMGSHFYSCRDFFKFDHLVIGSYSYFVYDDLGEQDGQPLP
jgi:hypothetical protein